MNFDFTEIIRSFAKILPVLFLSFFAGIARTLFNTNIKFGDFVRGAVLAIFVGYIVMLLINEKELGEGMKGAIVGISAFMADDVLMMIIRISKQIFEKPEEILKFFIKK